MARPSNRKPWIVEIQPNGVTGWYAMDAYADEDEARLQVELMQKRTPGSAFRYRDYRVEPS